MNTDNISMDYSLAIFAVTHLHIIDNYWSATWSTCHYVTIFRFTFRFHATRSALNTPWHCRPLQIQKTTQNTHLSLVYLFVMHAWTVDMYVRQAIELHVLLLLLYDYIPCTMQSDDDFLQHRIITWTQKASPARKNGSWSMNARKSVTGLFFISRSFPDAAVK